MTMTTTSSSSPRNLHLVGICGEVFSPSRLAYCDYPLPNLAGPYPATDSRCRPKLAVNMSITTESGPICAVSQSPILRHIAASQVATN